MTPLPPATETIVISFAPRVVTADVNRMPFAGPRRLPGLAPTLCVMASAPTGDPVAVTLFSLN